MQFPFTHPGFESQHLAIDLPHPFASARLLVNGQPAPAGPTKRTWRLRKDDGSEVVATRKGSAMLVDPVPRVLIEGTLHEVASRLPWYQVLACWLPVVLILTGGVIGGGAAGLAISINAHVFRSGWPAILTWGTVLAVMLSSFLLYLVVVGAFHLLRT